MLFLFFIRSWIRHPVDNFFWWRKKRNIPSVGDKVIDCRRVTQTITKIDSDGDTLTFEDGSRASWMHCCEAAC